MNFLDKVFLQNRLCSFCWSFGRKNGTILVFLQVVDNETVVKVCLF